MSQESPNETSSPWMAICLGIGLFAMLATMFLPSSPPGTREKAQITKCKNCLKQMGLSLNSYFSDGTSNAMPILKSFEVSPSNDGGFGFDANMLSCHAMHHGPSQNYVWNPKLSGSTWAIWNNPHSPWIWDATPHKVNGKINVLMGDGHVEDMTPERLKELTK